MLNNLSPRKADQRQETLEKQIQKNLNSHYANVAVMQLPMDLGAVSQDDINLTSSFLPHSQLNNSIIESEMRRIQANKFRISRLMYGKQGLISFMYHLFGLLSEKQMKRVTYYFAFKGQIDYLDEYARKKAQIELEKRMNQPIMEVYEEEKSPTNSKRETLDFGVV